jgi:hypothetical protein
VSNIQYFPFKNEYPYLSLKLMTEVEVFNTMQYQNKIKARALWDTGAMLSAVTPDIAKKLELISINRIKINNEIIDKLISFLSPYITKAEIKKHNRKIWTGKAEWLDTPVKMESFAPLTREETNARWN